MQYHTRFDFILKIDRLSKSHEMDECDINTASLVKDYADARAPDRHDSRVTGARADEAPM